MATIVPTITAADPHHYREQLERVTAFAPRIHIDFADGSLAPTKLIDIEKTWLPDDKTIDFHLMYQQPLDYIEAAIKQRPSCIIVHAEASAAHEALQMIRKASIRCGLAVLPQTPIEIINDFLPLLDQVLIFGGHLGYQGGQADLTLLPKVTQLKQLAPRLEVAWDGGVNDNNARQLCAAGIDVLNVGHFIQHAENPADAYAKLLALAEAING